MLTHLSLKNFRNLQDAAIDLTPLNVFVGANNSGKSNALLALSLLKHLVALGDFSQACEAIGCTPDNLITRTRERCTLGISASVGGSKVRYTLEFDRKGLGIDHFVADSPEFHVSRNNTPLSPNYSIGLTSFSGAIGSLLRELRQGHVILHEGARAFCEFLASVAVYDLSVTALRSEATIVPNPTLSRNGENLASVLDWLRDNNPESFRIVEDEVRAAARDIKSVGSRTTRQGNKILALRQQDGQIFDASVLSDGLVLFVGLAVAAVSSRHTPRLIAVEEPERGVHPQRLREVLNAFERVSNRGTQIILTTHSPLVLDTFKDNPDSVFVFDRGDSGTRVGRLSDNPLASELDGLALGEAWYSGVLGGVPPP